MTLGYVASLLLWVALEGVGPLAQSQASTAPRPAPHVGSRIHLSAQGATHGEADGGHEMRSMLNIAKPMHFGSFVWDEDGVPKGAVWVRIDLTRQLISVFRGGHEIGSAVILYGADSKPTPTGNFTILEKDSDYHSRRYDAPMPFMLRLTNDGVAIHGSKVREGLATHGCLGAPLEFSRLLFGVAKVGDQVTVLPAQRQVGSRTSP